MIKIYGFNINNPLKLMKQRIVLYFENLGYKMVENSDYKMRFKRGNTFNDFLFLRPQKWKTQVHIDIEKIGELNYKLVVCIKLNANFMFRNPTIDEYLDIEMLKFTNSIRFSKNESCKSALKVGVFNQFKFLIVSILIGNIVGVACLYLIYNALKIFFPIILTVIFLLFINLLVSFLLRLVYTYFFENELIEKTDCKIIV